MDNVTHTLVGLTIGQSFNRLRGEALDSRIPVATLWAAAIASNIPDLDFVLHGMLADPKLAYLVHHRGYSHSLVFLPIFATLSIVPALFVAKLRVSDAKAWRMLAWPALIGVFFHIAADFCNEYGVHPFFPFSNRWFYGDFIFILEPVFLLALLPLAFTQARTRVGRVVWGTLELVLYFFIWTNGLATPLMRVGVSIWGAFFAVWQWKRPAALLPAYVGLVLGLSVFLGSSWKARSVVLSELVAKRPGERTLQLASSPAPGNPFQWRMVLATVDLLGEYRVRVGTLNFFAQNALPTGFPGPGYETTAPMTESTLPSTENLRWMGEFHRPLSELQGLTEKYCRLRALLRFTRTPYWMPSEGGLIAGDLRYDRERGLGFTEFLLRSDEPCLPSEPPWEPPVGSRPVKPSS